MSENSSNKAQKSSGNNKFGTSSDTSNNSNGYNQYVMSGEKIDELVDSMKMLSNKIDLAVERMDVAIGRMDGAMARMDGAIARMDNSIAEIKKSNQNQEKIFELLVQLTQKYVVPK